MRQLKYSEVFLAATHDLDSYRKPFGREATRDGGRWVAVAEMYQQDFIQSM